MYDYPFFIIAPAPEHGTFSRCGASDLIHCHIHVFISNSFCHFSLSSDWLEKISHFVLSKKYTPTCMKNELEIYA